MAHLRLITLCSLLLSVTFAQQYSGNYVESDYDYDQPPPPPRPAPAPRSFSRPPPPSSSSLRSLGSSSSSSSSSARVTPVPILKQINRHNEDGSYTYGYEGADGSFKIETKLTNGEVMGKYGYVDDIGKVRVVEYGANKFGFMPSGEGITVAPPTLVDETRKGDAQDYDDGQYYEQPAPRAPVSSPRFSPRPGPPPPRPAPRPAPAPVRPPPPPQSQSRGYETYETETDFSAPAPAPSPPRPSNLGPAPPRAQIPGAAPSGGPNTGIVYSPSQRPPRPQSFSAPSPPRPNPPAPSQSPAFRPQSSFSAPSRPQARQAGGILDQLAKDYALPPGGQPLHDITFGFY